MDPATAIINDILSTLPKMADYIITHIDRNVPSQTVQGQKCLICQQNFVIDPDEDEDCFPGSQDTTCVRLPPCNHMFHGHCIQIWLDSTQPARNSCPTCRTHFCKLNVLDPITQATVDSKLTHNQAGFYNIANHATILAFVDTQFASQGPGDKANYIAIPRATRDFWEGRGNDVVCSEHFTVGSHWVEMAAADRVKERLLEEGLVKTWPGVQFMGMWVNMKGQFQQSYPAAVRFSFLVQAGAAQDASQEVWSDGRSTVVDEGLYRDHLARHPPITQGLVQGLLSGQEAGVFRSWEGSTVADEDLYTDYLARHPPIGPGFDANVEDISAAAQQNVPDVASPAPDLASPAREPPTTPPSKPSAVFDQIQAHHGKDFVKWDEHDDCSPTRPVNEAKNTKWVQDTHVNQSAPSSFASEAVAWRAQRSASESIVWDDPTDDEMDGDVTPTRSPEYNPGPVAPPIQWVTTPTFPPVRPVPEPIDDLVYVPPTPAEARWMARVEKRKKEPVDKKRVYRPTGIWDQ